MTTLATGQCVACRGGEPTLTEAEIVELRPQVPQWEVVAHTCPGGRCQGNDILRLQRVFKLKNFVEALAFTTKIGAVAEEQGHHPLIVTEWGRVTVQWWTHIINGLHRNDFIMAAKMDEIFG